MKITLYKTPSSPNKIDKTLKGERVYENIILKEDTDVTNPVIIISGIPKAETISDYNYAYIPQFHRYYWIENITFTKRGLIELSMRVDVLMSYKESILNSKQLIDRVEEKGKMYLTNYDWTTDERTYTRTDKFTEDHFNRNDDSYILVTV